MKATFLAGRADSSGKHNDRNFDISKAKHIEEERIIENKYWTYNGNTSKTFEQLELEYYTKNFYAHIAAQNERNTKMRHPSRNKTVEQYFRSHRTQPEDVILQVGNKDSHIDKELLWECALEYEKRFSEAYGRSCKILDMALHNDEATPHVHIRRVWIGEDDYGHLQVSQRKGLEALGYVRPDLDQAYSRTNNPKITFTRQERTLFENICKEKGLDIDISNREKREHLSVSEYKQKKVKDATKEMERYLEDLKKQAKTIENTKEQVDEFTTSYIDMMESSSYYANLYREQLENIRRMNDKKLRDKAILKLFKESTGHVVSKDVDFRAAIASAEVELKYSKMRHFLEQKGLLEEYQQYNAQRDRTIEKNYNKQKVKPLI